MRGIFAANRHRALSAAFAAFFAFALAVSLPWTAARAAVEAATPTAPATFDHVYALDGATSAEVLANVKADFRDAISHQYATFQLASSTAAAHAYLLAYLPRPTPTPTGFAVKSLNDFLYLYYDLLNRGSDVPGARGFDYEAGICAGVNVGAGGTIDTDPATSLKLSVAVTWRETPAQRAAVLAHVRAFLDGEEYRSLSTDEQRLQAIDSYIVRTFAYDSPAAGGGNGNASPYAMIDPASPSYGRGICLAYSLYGYLMLTEAGFPTRAVLSRYGNSKDGKHVISSPYVKKTSNGVTSYPGHAWDIVHVGGAWYHIDFTFDDGGSTSPLSYFMKTDAQMTSLAHYWQNARLADDTTKSAVLLDSATGLNYYPAATTLWMGTAPTPTTAPTMGATPTPKPTAIPTPKPAASPTPKPTASPTRAPTATSAATPTPSDAPSPMDTPTASPAPEPTPSPTPVASATPNATPTALLLDLTVQPTDLPATPTDFVSQAFDGFVAAWANDPGVPIATCAGAASLLLFSYYLIRRRTGRR